MNRFSSFRCQWIANFGWYITIPPLQFSQFFIAWILNFLNKKMVQFFKPSFIVQLCNHQWWDPTITCIQTHARGRGDVRALHASPLCESAVTETLYAICYISPRRTIEGVSHLSNEVPLPHSWLCFCDRYWLTYLSVSKLNVHTFACDRCVSAVKNRPIFLLRKFRISCDKKMWKL